MATGDIGYLSKVGYQDDSGVWQEVYQVRNVTMPRKTINRVDFSHLQSPGRTKEYKPGFGEWSALTAEAPYDYTAVSHGQILSDAQPATGGEVQRSWRVQLCNSTTGVVEETWMWTGSVGEAGLGALSGEEPRLLSFSVNVDGAITIT